MGVRVLFNEEENIACLYDSVTMWAFGPVFCSGNDEIPANERIATFANWLSDDPRTYGDQALETKYAEYLVAENEGKQYFGGEKEKDDVQK